MRSSGRNGQLAHTGQARASSLLSTGGHGLICSTAHDCAWVPELLHVSLSDHPPMQRCDPTTWLLTRSTSVEATAEACILQAVQLQHHVITL